MDNYSAISKAFSYGKTNVRMRVISDRNIQVCVTDFAKAFPGKNLGKIVNSQEIQEYVSKLSEITNVISADLLQVTKGGNPTEQGTWANSKVALRIAQKLSTDFAIWVDGHVEELLTKGKTSVYSMPQTYAEALRELADQAEKNERLMLENRRQADKIVEDAPKVVFADAVQASRDNILIRQLVKFIQQNGVRMGELELFEWMHRHGYLCKVGKNPHVPTRKSMDLQVMVQKENVVVTGTVTFTSITPLITPKGQMYFLNKHLHQELELFQ